MGFTWQEEKKPETKIPTQQGSNNPKGTGGFSWQEQSPVVSQRKSNGESESVTKAIESIKEPKRNIFQKYMDFSERMQDKVAKPVAFTTGFIGAGAVSSIGSSIGAFAKTKEKVTGALGGFDPTKSIPENAMSLFIDKVITPGKEDEESGGQKVGDSLKDYGEKSTQAIVNLQGKEMNYIQKVAQGLGSSIPYIVGGAGLKAAQVSAWMASVGMSGVEALVNGYEDYETNKESGMSEKDATKRAIGSFASNFAWGTITNKLGGFFDDLSPGVAPMVKRFLATTFFETTEEVGQTMISNIFTGKSLDEGLGETALVSLPISALFGASGVTVSPQAVTKTVDFLKESAKDGMTQEQIVEIFGALPGTNKETIQANLDELSIEYGIDETFDANQEKEDERILNEIESEFKDTEPYLYKEAPVDEAKFKTEETSMDQEAKGETPKTNSAKEAVAKGLTEGKYKITINIQDKNDVDYLRRILSDDQIKDIQNGKMTNWRGTPYSDLARVNLVSKTPQTIAQQLKGKIKDVKLKSDTFFHGTNSENTQAIRTSGFKQGSKLPENISRGGGYGKMQNSISFAETPKEASIFSTLTKNGEIIEAKLKSNSRIVSIEGIEDAIDLEDYIAYLKKEKIDAVYIGGGEKELVVINPKIIQTVLKANNKETESKPAFKIIDEKDEVGELISSKKTRQVTSQFFNHSDIKGKESISSSYLSNLAKSKSFVLKQQERDIIQNVLDTQFSDQKKVNMQDFYNAVIGELLPLEVIQSDTYANYGVDNIGLGNTENKTYILNSPFDHGKTGHFRNDFESEISPRNTEIRELPITEQNKSVKYAVVNKDAVLNEENINENVYTVTNTREQAQKWIDDRIASAEKDDSSMATKNKKGLFGHFRSFDDYSENVSYIGEIQSDSFQSLSSLNLTNSDITNKKKEIVGYQEEIDKRTALLPDEDQSRIDELQERIDTITKQIEAKVPETVPKEETSFLGYKNIWFERIVREALNIKAKEGFDAVRFPTPRTVAIIEGFAGGEGEMMPYEYDGDRDTDLALGDTITYGGEEMTVLDANPYDITVAPSDGVRGFDSNEYMDEEIEGRWSEAIYGFSGMEDDFGKINTPEKATDIQGKIDIYNKQINFNNKQRDIVREKEYLQNKKESGDFTSGHNSYGNIEQKVDEYTKFIDLLKNNILEKEGIFTEDDLTMELKDKLGRDHALGHRFWNYLNDYLPDNATAKTTEQVVQETVEKVTPILEEYETEKREADVIFSQIEKKAEEKISGIKDRKAPSSKELESLPQKLQETIMGREWQYNIEYGTEWLLEQMSESEEDTLDVNDYEDQFKENEGYNYEADFEGMYGKDKVFYENRGYTTTVWVTENDTETFSQPSEYDLASSVEDFDINDFDGSQRTVLEFYRKQLNKYVEKLRKGNTEIITDDIGNQWIETKITPEDSDAVPAYKVQNENKKVDASTAVARIRDLSKRHGVEFTTQVYNKIYTGEVINGSPQQAFGMYLDGTIALAEMVTTFTGDHEFGHLIFDNLENLPHFKMTKEELYTELRAMPGNKNKTKIQLEESLMDMVETYAKQVESNKPTTLKGKVLAFVKRVYNSLRSTLDMNKKEAEAVQSFLDTMYFGDSKTITTLQNTNKASSFMDARFKEFGEEPKNLTDVYTPEQISMATMEAEYNQLLLDESIDIPLDTEVPGELQEEKIQLEIWKYLISQNPMANLEKYESRSGEMEGSLPEVLGMGIEELSDTTYKRVRRSETLDYIRRGDAIIPELTGIDDVNEVAQLYDEYKVDKKEYRQALKDFRKRISDFKIIQKDSKALDNWFKKQVIDNQKRDVKLKKRRDDVNKILLRGKKKGIKIGERAGIKIGKATTTNKYVSKIEQMTRAQELNRLQENIIRRSYERGALQYIKENIPRKEHGAYMLRLTQVGLSDAKYSNLIEAISERKKKLDIKEGDRAERASVRSSIGYLRKIFDIEPSLIIDIKKDLDIKGYYKTGPKKGQQKTSLKSIKDYTMEELGMFKEELQKRIQFRIDNKVNYLDHATLEVKKTGWRVIPSKIANIVKKGDQKFVAPMERQIKKISPALYERMMTVFYEIDRTRDAYFKKIEPLYATYNKATDEDQELIKQYSQSSEVVKLESVLLKYESEENVKEMLKQSREVLDSIHSDLNSVEINVPYRGSFFPRKLKKLDIQEAELMLKTFENKMGRKATEEEKTKIMTNLLRGFDTAQLPFITLSGKKFESYRLIETITPELSPFYEGFKTSMDAYIISAVTTIEQRKFFGRFAISNMDYKAGLEQSIGAKVMNLRDTGVITSKEMDIVEDTLKTMFSFRIDEWGQEMQQFTNDYVYPLVLSGVGNAINQIRDLSMQIIQDVMVGQFNLIGRQTYKSTDFTSGASDVFEIESGVEASSNWLAKVLRKGMLMFKGSDQFFLGTLSNSSVRRMTNLAKKNDKRFTQRMIDIFGEKKAGDIIMKLQSMKAGEKLDMDSELFESVNRWIYSEVARTRPITKLQKARGAVRHPLWYTLKNFTVKQFQFIREESIDIIAEGVRTKDAKMVAEGSGRLAVAMTIIGAVGAGTGELIDFVYGDDDDDFWDKVMDNILQVFGFSNYIFRGAKRNGLGGQVVASYSPATISIMAGLFDDIHKDIKDVLDGDPLYEARVIKRIPVIGRLFYELFGGGK